MPTSIASSSSVLGDEPAVIIYTPRPTAGTPISTNTSSPQDAGPNVPHPTTTLHQQILDSSDDWFADVFLTNCKLDDEQAVKLF